jgi:predicted ABC-type sugar transport system permease subunit
MRTKTFWAALGLAALLLGACGPMIGGMMVAGNGVKDFRVTGGSLATLRPGAHLAIV